MHQRENFSELIVAIATPPGRGGVGVVRVSGTGALGLAASFLGRPPIPRHAHYSKFRDATGEVMDDGLLLAFPAPHSFTGEDIVELQAHGSPIALAALVERCIALGARHARPGEFSERAYLNGKLDLVQAEAIADLIAAGSQEAARGAALFGRCVQRARACAGEPGAALARVHRSGDRFSRRGNRFSAHR